LKGSAGLRERAPPLFFQSAFWPCIKRKEYSGTQPWVSALVWIDRYTNRYISIKYTHPVFAAHATELHSHSYHYGTFFAPTFQETLESVESWYTSWQRDVKFKSVESW